MKTYTELTEKLKAGNGNSAEEHLREAQDARRQAEAFRAMKAEAVVSGDQEAHADICRKITFYEERAAIEEARAKTAGVPVNAYVEAWESYAEDYNKAFRKKVAAFTKARNEMAQLYMDLLKIRAEGNNEKQTMAENLKGRRVGCKYITETLTALESMPETFAKNGQTAEEAITAAALHLDAGRCDNMRGIVSGWNTDNDIYKESLFETVARKEAEKPARPVFPYPVYLPETEEQEQTRKLRGDYNPPVGYVLRDGLSITYKEDKDFYKHQEQKAREEALKTPVNND